jgi:hypothetical protein
VTFSVYQYARFFVGNLTTTANTVVATVPAATQWMIKDVHVTNFLGSAATVNIDMPGSTSGFFGGMSVPGNTSIHWTGLIVLNAGETIQAWSNTATTISVYISGQTGV